MNTYRIWIDGRPETMAEVQAATSYAARSAFAAQHLVPIWSVVSVNLAHAKLALAFPKGAST